MMNQVCFARAGLITAAPRTIEDINILPADLTTGCRDQGEHRDDHDHEDCTAAVTPPSTTQTNTVTISCG
jgi:hypothetical protein